MAMGYYLLTNLQWYNYKIKRVLLNHHRKTWHLIYFFLPVLVYYFAGEFFLFYFYFIYLPSLHLWQRRLDRPLKFTQRIQRFFLILFGITIFGDTLCVSTQSCAHFGIFLPIGFALVLSSIIESTLLSRYAQLAEEKLQSLDKLQIIAITASFGKTSLKNFLAQILESKYRVHATPRSVNTYAGIIKDINEELDGLTDIYIAEAGAREKGDILEISRLLEQHYAILGKIGEQHIEYFKTLENIKETKMEILESRRLKRAWIYAENGIDIKNSTYRYFPQGVKNIEATLEGSTFELNVDGIDVKFSTPVLGAFNVINISAAIYMAKELQIPIDIIQKKVATLKPVEHRLNKMEVNGKLILDDSFNGNLEGMLEAIRLASLYEGRKIIVTPGLVESNEESNIQLAQAIDTVFDVAIITGELNSKTLSEHIFNPQKIILKEKSNMTDILKGTSHGGDLILFANDAPNYV